MKFSINGIEAELNYLKNTNKTNRNKQVEREGKREQGEKEKFKQKKEVRSTMTAPLGKNK